MQRLCGIKIVAFLYGFVCLCHACDWFCATLSASSAQGVRAESVPVEAASAGSLKELHIRAGEIRLNGTLREIDLSRQTLVLDASSFTLPTGRSSQLAAPKVKTITWSAQTLLHRRGQVQNALRWTDLARGAEMSVVGPDSGSGRALLAREVAVGMADMAHAAMPGTAAPISGAPTPSAPAPGTPPAPSVATTPTTASPATMPLATMPPTTAPSATAPAQGRPEFVLQVGHRRDIQAMAYSPDSQFLASLGGDGTVQIWDVRDGTCRRTLQGHGESGAGLAFAPRGDMLAVTAEDRSGPLVNLWKPRAGRFLRSFKLEAGAGTSVLRFTSDGKTLVVMPLKIDPPHVEMWNVADGTLIKKVPLPAVRGLSIRERVLSPDGLQLAMSAYSVRDLAGARGFPPEKLYLLDTQSGEVRWKEDFPKQVRGMAFSYDGQIVAASSGDKTIKLWEAATGKLLRVMEKDSIGGLAFPPDGKSLAGAVAGGDDKIYIWDMQTGAERGALRSAGGMIAFSPDGGTFAAQMGPSIQLWDVTTGQPKSLLRGDQIKVPTATFLPGSDTLVLSNDDGGNLIRLWHMQKGSLESVVCEVNSSVNKVVAAPDGDLIAVVSTNRSMLFDIRRRKEIQGGQEEVGDGVNDLAFSPDGKLLAIGSPNRSVRLWDMAGGKLRGTLSHNAPVIAVAFSPDGKLVAAVGMENNVPALFRYNMTAEEFKEAVREHGSRALVRVWDVESGEMKKELPKFDLPIWDAAFSPDGASLATGAQDGTLTLWDTTTWSAQKTWKSPQGGAIKQIAFSPDGKRIATGHEAGRALLWDAGSGQARELPTYDEVKVPLVAWNSSGNLLAGVGENGAVSVWSKSGTLLATLLITPDRHNHRNHERPPWIVFTPDGYYDGPPVADEYVLWRVGGEMFPAARFAAQYRRPDMVQKALQDR
jgi:WD40 repeat protein